MTDNGISFQLYVNKDFTIGFLVRTIEVDLGRPDHAALSRKTGEWVRISAQQIREEDIPSECIFAADHLPKPPRTQRVSSASNGGG